MNPKKLNKKQAKEFIEKTFSKPASSNEIKKAKRVAMSKNIKLGKLKRKFCDHCLTWFTPNNTEIRIRKPYKIIKCKNCGNVSRYKIS